MISEKLDFRHKELLFEQLRKIDTPISEYSFPNLYLFRDVHAYEVVSAREIFIRGISYDGFTYLMPTVDIREMDTDYIREIIQSVDYLFPVPESWLSHFPNDIFGFTAKKGEMDYIYTAEKMRSYRGRNLHKKRNLLKQFLTSYTHDALPLTEERKGDAISILREWKKETGQAPAETDYSQCLEALKMSEELLLCGGIYYADNEPAGFILGEELNNETFVLHFAKAKKKFKGIYQFMINNFAGILPVRYAYLNLEQDLDRETLRIAKSSYIPDILLRKYRVYVKNNQGRVTDRGKL